MEREQARPQNTLWANWLLAAGLLTVAALKATDNQTVAAAVLGLVVAASWLNVIRFVSRWRELRRQILLESVALAFALSFIATVSYTAVAGVLECACRFTPATAEYFMLGALIVSALITWLRYR